jgi:hypothetical protein
LSRLLSKNGLNIKVYSTIILPFVLYGRKTWSLALKEGYRLWVFENRVKVKVKVKVKGPCALTEHYAMEVYWESGGIDPLIL